MYLEAFLNYIKYEKRYSQNTFLSYAKDLEQFTTFCDINKKQLINADHKLIRTWIISLIDNQISTRTINRKITSLKSFYKFLIREGKLKTNPLDKVLTLKITKELPSFVKENEMNLLLDGEYFTNDFEGIRDRFIIELFYATGIRLTELINLKISNVDENSLVIKVLGKRNKERIIPVTSQIVSLFRMYFEKRNAVLKDSKNIFVFVTKNGEKVYTKLVYRVVNRYLTYISTIKKKSPHVLRHTFATHMLNKGADLNAIKELLGHANLAATQVYIHNTFEELKSIYNQAHPRA